jgi:hypothetical protein
MGLTPLGGIDIGEMLDVNSCASSLDGYSLLLLTLSRSLELNIEENAVRSKEVK